MTLPTALVVVVMVVLVAATPSLGAAVMEADGYFHGRATFYTDNQQGSCHFYSDIPSAGYAAWPDTQQGFKGSCGTCWQVSCVNRDFTDGYGAWIERSSACYDENKAITVKIVDSCPCVHENFYSNQRWCCGDSAHIDLADTVFAQLANPSLGVVAARWRQVSCDQVGSVVQLGPGGSQLDQQQPSTSDTSASGGDTSSQQPWTDQSSDLLSMQAQAQQQSTQAQAQQQSAQAQAQQQFAQAQTHFQQAWPMGWQPTSTSFPHFGWRRQ